jgi:membrane protease YdiL (CAAX protease family)
MVKNENTNIKPMGIPESILFFGIPSFFLFLAANVTVPLMHEFTGIPKVVCWFINACTDVFILLLIFSFVFYRAEGNQIIVSGVKERFRLRKMSIKDLKWVLGSLIIIGALTGLIIFIIKQVNPVFSYQPSFIEIEPLEKNDLWIFWLGIPVFLIGIFGVELFFRGYVFPRQEKYFGNRTWLIHGFLWLMFHASFGLNFLIMLIPVVFISSYAVQKTGNTYVSILINGVINGLAFLAVVFGLI